MICLYSPESVLLMDPCMLDDGLDPPHMDTGPLPSAKLGLMGAKREQSPSLFSGQDTESSFCWFIMCSHRRSSQRVRNLCEMDWAGSFFTFTRMIWDMIVFVLFVFFIKETFPSFKKSNILTDLQTVFAQSFLCKLWHCIPPTDTMVHNMQILKCNWLVEDQPQH